MTDISGLQADFYSLYKAKQARSIINQAAKDVIQKGLVPKYTHAYFKDKSMLEAAAQNLIKNGLNQKFVCSQCNLEFPTKEMLKQHLKIHWNKGERRENENKQTKVRLY